MKEIFKEQANVLMLGKKRCMPVGTLIRTPNGIKKIEDVKEVLSYNFKENKVEPKKAKVHSTGKKQIVKIHTSKGTFICSPEHKWIVIRNKSIKTIETKDLKVTDYLLSVEEDYQ